MPAAHKTARLFSALAVATATALGACTDPYGSDGSGDTEIRLRNGSSFELTGVTFNPGSAAITAARIGPGETTGYKSVDRAYRYGYLDLDVGGERRRIQPIDYVGESLVGAGRFTYVITIEPASRNPSVAVVRD